MCTSDAGRSTYREMPSGPRSTPVSSNGLRPRGAGWITTPSSLGSTAAYPPAPSTALPPLGGRILQAAYRALFVSEFFFSASLTGGEAVLRFPYHEGLRKLLRAIPGRRWDPVQRAW